MSIGMGVTSVVYGAADGNLNSAADLLTFTPAKPIDVVRYGVIIDSATASGTTLVLSLDKQPTAGSSTGRTEIETLTPASTVAQGNGVYKDVMGSGTEPAPPGRVQINPGEEVVVEVKTAAGVATTGRTFIEYIEYPFAGSRLENMTEVTS